MPSDHHEVFVSYPSADAAVAETVVEALEGSGVRCWIAPRDVEAGQDWAGSIIEAIETAKLLVLVYTDATNSSEHILREVRQGADSGIAILPFRTTDADLAPALAYYLGGTHWLDAYGGDLAEHLDKLVQRVQAILAGEQSWKRRANVAARNRAPTRTSPPPWWKRIPASAVALAAMGVVTAILIGMLSVDDDPSEQAAEPTTTSPTLATTPSSAGPTDLSRSEVTVEMRGIVPERELSVYGIAGAVGIRFGFDGVEIWSHTPDEIATFLSSPVQFRGVGDAGALETDEIVLYMPAVPGEHLLQLDFPDGRTARTVFEIPAGEGPHIEVGDGIDPETITWVESSLREAAATTAEVTGYAIGDYTVFVEPDEQAMAARHCEVRSGPCETYAGYWQGRGVSLDEGDLFVVESHTQTATSQGGVFLDYLYARLVMGEGAGQPASDELDDDVVPTWLWEGTQIHLGSHIAFARDWPPDDATMRANARYDTAGRPDLASLEDTSGWRSTDPDRAGRIASFAVYVLWRDFPSDTGPLGFFDALRGGAPWEEAFERAHGLTVDEFYTHFGNL